MKRPALASGSHFIICPICEAGEMRSGGHDGFRCPVCGRTLGRGILEALQQIITLPDALGKHACEECGHPEMRRLPDGVSHCPGCSSEVLPTTFNCHTQAVGTSRDHRQGGGGENIGAPPAPRKISQRCVSPAPEGGKS